MFNRAAATTAAILIPFGVAVAVPVMTQNGGVPAAQAGADNASPGDDLTDENLPEDGQQPPTPTPPPPVAPPTPAPLPELPPRPQDTLENDGSDDSNLNSGESNGSSGEKSVDERSGSRPSGTNGRGTRSQTLSVSASNTSTVSDTGAFPQG